MSVLRHLPGLVLATCILVTAAAGANLAALWIGLLGLGAAVQAGALWSRYRR